jgi:hypothetical protein
MSQPWTPSAPPTTAPVQNYLVPAILATIFCCLPVGVAAIIFATQVNTKLAEGDLPGAQEASRKAKMFMFIAIGLGLVSLIGGVLIWVFVFGVAALSNM